MHWRSRCRVTHGTSATSAHQSGRRCSRAIPADPHPATDHLGMRYRIARPLCGDVEPRLLRAERGVWDRHRSRCSDIVGSAENAESGTLQQRTHLLREDHMDRAASPPPCSVLGGPMCLRPALLPRRTAHRRRRSLAAQDPCRSLHLRVSARRAAGRRAMPGVRRPLDHDVVRAHTLEARSPSCTFSSARDPRSFSVASLSLSMIAA
jgi:hypothetical protein